MKIKLLTKAIAVLLTLALPLAPAAAQQSSPLSQSQADAVRALVLQTIRENPDVVVDAIMAYQAQADADAEAQRRTAIGRLATEMERDPNAASLGNPDGETVLIEFFDYNCPYCKRAAPVILELIKENPDLRVVMREWPILGPDSEEAARASLASRAQDGYQAFHEALMAQPRANAMFLRRAAEQAGLDYERLQSDMKSPEITAHIEQSRALARQLGVTGTPTFVIGDSVVPGLVPKEALAGLIADADRMAGGQ